MSTLEQVYADVLLEPEDQDKARTTKKRKMDVATSASQPATPGDDDDDMYWGAMGHGKGKKAKGGTGYAGEVKEDVSIRPFIRLEPYSLVSDLRSSRSTSHSAPERRENRPITYPNPCLPSFTTPTRRWSDQRLSGASYRTGTSPKTIQLYLQRPSSK